MIIKYFRKTELEAKFAPYNPRWISEFELTNLRNSIQKFGFVVPVVINTRTGRIVSGHQRVVAIEDPDFQIPAIEIDTDEDQEKLLNVALNRIRGKFDAEKLDKVFRFLAEKNADIGITGFGILGVMELRQLLGINKKQQAEFEQFPFHVPRKDVLKIREALTVAKAQKERMDEERQENGNSNACALTIIAKAVLTVPPKP